MSSPITPHVIRSRGLCVCFEAVARMTACRVQTEWTTSCNNSGTKTCPLNISTWPCFTRKDDAGCQQSALCSRRLPINTMNPPLGEGIFGVLLSGFRATPALLPTRSRTCMSYTNKYYSCERCTNWQRTLLRAVNASFRTSIPVTTVSH